MQVEYGQGVLKADAAVVATQLCHRIAIVATLLVLGVLVMVVRAKEPRPVAVAALIAADIAVVLGGVALVATYRKRRSLREVMGVFFFALLLAHLATYWLLTEYRGLAAVRELLRGWGIVK